MLWRLVTMSRTVEDLKLRVGKLEAERAQRELETSELLAQLHRHLLRMRQRDRRDRERLLSEDSASGEEPLDEISRMIINRRRGNGAP